MTVIDEAGTALPAGQSGNYWRESTRPLVSLAFVMPMLLAYEGGVLLLGERAARNGIDVLLRWFLGLLGFGQYFLLPLLTAAILLGWHHTTGRPWRFRAALLPCMLLESAALGLVLLMLAQLHSTLFAQLPDWSSAATSAKGTVASTTTRTDETGGNQSSGAVNAQASRIVAYFGAGIYEELLFRLMLLPVAAAGFKLCGMSNGWSLIAALLVTSLVFSGAHYRLFTSVGDEFAWFSFVFRAVAGLFFSMLFLYRGFGIAVGAHALYDILVVML